MESIGYGIVINVHAKMCLVVSEADGQEITCQLRGKLFEKLKGHTKPVAVGDRISFRTTEEGAAIEEILPRRNALTRPAGKRRDEIQTIAANIDRVLVVAAVKDPPLRLGLIDRFLVAAEMEDLEAILCLNKIDLLAPQETADLERETASLYSDLDYPVFLTSAISGEGVEELKEQMKNRTSLIMGHSGVGKSTLINRIDPLQQLKTGSISSKQKKGRHTTTSVSLLRLAGGGYVVDTPGIRAFGINEMREGDLGLFFREMAALLPDCQYPDCTHRHEPGCAVLCALEEGRIPESRYKSYLRIMEEIS